MRFMKSGWMGAVTLGSLVAVQPLIHAQEKKDDKPAAPPVANPAPVAPTVKPGPPISGAELRARRTEGRLMQMTRMYGLTEEQKPKVKAILEDQFKQIEDVQQDKALAPEERRKKFMAINESSQAKIKALLTPEQQQKMDAMRRPPGGAAPTAPAPTAPAPAPAK